MASFRSVFGDLIKSGVIVPNNEREKVSPPPAKRQKSALGDLDTNVVQPLPVSSTFQQMSSCQQKSKPGGTTQRRRIFHEKENMLSTSRFTDNQKSRQNSSIVEGDPEICPPPLDISSPVTPVSAPTHHFESDGHQVTPISAPTHHSEPDAPQVTPVSAPTHQSEPDTQASSKRAAKTPEEKKQRDLLKYKLLPSCSCKKNCLCKIPEERRQLIHDQFWDEEYSARRAWLFAHVKTSEPQRIGKFGIIDPRRKTSRFYVLPDADGKDVFVCKVFFLHTLGYKSDKIITVTLGTASPNNITTPQDKRGKHAPAHKISDEKMKKIKDHIMSYNPAVSHYRREHAPQRRYLPSELSATAMYQDFNTTNPGICGREMYRKVLKEMNISFAKLGHEECETCLEYETHKKNVSEEEPCTTASEIEDDICKVCSEWVKHKERAGVARSWYNIDKERERSPEESICSVDMQKVIMLPRMPGVKSCVFTRRLVQFHMTFAPLGGAKSTGDPVIGVVWNEAVAGRNAEDVASSYIKFINSPQYRDRKHFTFYMDNCTAQNKNWTIFTTMVAEVNRDGEGPEEIKFKYLEKGHTFMSADAFHSKVEKGMKEMKDVMDGDDFVRVINSTSQGCAIQMDHTDFKLYENGLSSGKYTNRPLLSEIQEVKFIRGSRMMHWKTSMDDGPYQSGEFLKKKTAEKIMRGQPYPPMERPRGIEERKKNDIITKLCRFMPTNRHGFWKGLVVNDSSPDLLDNQ